MVRINEKTLGESRFFRDYLVRIIEVRIIEDVLYYDYHYSYPVFGQSPISIPLEMNPLQIDTACNDKVIEKVTIEEENEDECEIELCS